MALNVSTPISSWMNTYQRSHAEFVIATAMSGTDYEEARYKISSFTYVEAVSNTELALL